MFQTAFVDEVAIENASQAQRNSKASSSLEKKDCSIIFGRFQNRCKGGSKSDFETKAVSKVYDSDIITKI